MTSCSLFTQSDQNVKFFLLEYFNFLIQFDLCNDDTLEQHFKEQSMAQSFILVKHVIFYYDVRDLLIEQLNISSHMFYCKKERFSTLFKHIPDTQKQYFKNLNHIFNDYFNKLFIASDNIYICTKDSQLSVPWINPNERQAVFYKCLS